MLLACKIEPKKLLLGTLTVFSTCQVLSVISIGFPFLVVSRIGVACAHSIFWAIASPLAVRVVSKEHQSKALSAIITGTAIAMVLGMPLGRMIGLQIGWRMTFLCVSVISFLVLVYLAFVFPKIENTESFSINQLPELFKNSRLMITYIITFLLQLDTIQLIVTLNHFTESCWISKHPSDYHINVIWCCWTFRKLSLFSIL